MNLKTNITCCQILCFCYCNANRTISKMKESNNSKNKKWSSMNYDLNSFKCFAPKVEILKQLSGTKNI